MVVVRSKRMAIVLTLAERAEATAAQRLQEARHQCQMDEDKLQELKEYHQDYADQIDQRREGLTAQIIMTYRHFLQQLEQSVEVQGAKVKQAGLLCERLLVEWQQLYHRRRSIGELIERLQKTESSILEKRLQKEIDELTTLNQHRRGSDQ